MTEALLRPAKLALYYGACAGRAEWYFALKGRLMRTAARLGLYERECMRLLPALVRTGDVAVDAGAHLGAYTHALARLVGPSGRVLAFEPVPPVADALERSCAGWPQVTVIRQALSDKSGSVALRVPCLPGGVPEPALAHAVDAEAPGRTLSTWRSFTAAAVRLDDYCATMPAVAFIKADLEGHETALLAGARETIERCRPIFQLEASGLMSRDGRWPELPGYALLRLSRGVIGPLQTGERAPLNLYLVPREVEARVRALGRESAASAR
jgi:FkbM family methyltransferase